MKNMNALVLRCMESFLPSVPSVFSSPTFSEDQGISNKLYMRRDRKYVNREKTADDQKGLRDYSIDNAKPRINKKEASKAITIEQIMEYQGLDEEDLSKAAEILMQP